MMRRCFRRCFPRIHLHPLWERTRHVVLDVIEHTITQVLEALRMISRDMEDTMQDKSIRQSKVHEPPEQSSFPSFRKKVSLTRTTTTKFYTAPPNCSNHAPIVFQGHLRCLHGFGTIPSTSFHISLITPKVGQIA